MEPGYLSEMTAEVSEQVCRPSCRVRAQAGKRGDWGRVDRASSTALVGSLKDLPHPRSQNWGSLNYRISVVITQRASVTRSLCDFSEYSMNGGVVGLPLGP